MNHILLAADEATIISGLDATFKIAGKMGMRLLIDVLAVTILVRYIYYPLYKHRDLFFTFFIFNLIIFLISFLLNKVDLSMGAAFGLFAVFSMLRYRTEDISIKDMTYLFLSIAIGLVCAVTKIKDASDTYEYFFLGIICSITLIITWLLESSVLMKKEMVKVVIYENIELIQANREAELLLDLSTRTGLKVHRVSIQRIDFLRDAAQIKIYYYA